LEITEAEPLVAYIASTIDAPTALAAKSTESLARLAQEEIRRHGSIHATTDTGIFIARGHR
jgi:hypothetical protein